MGAYETHGFAEDPDECLIEDYGGVGQEVVG